MAPALQPSYLSGIVIGEEMRSRALRGTEHIALIGAPALTQRYARALASRGVHSEAVGAQAGWRGLHDMARTIHR
jgi:2-dehydro-3-deoxygalactonokinase